MSIALVVTAGFGNGTLTGSVSDVVTSGYSVGAELSVWTLKADEVTIWSDQVDSVTTWSDQVDSVTIWTVQ